MDCNPVDEIFRYCFGFFIDKTQVPSNAHLKKALGSCFELWEELYNFTLKSYPGAKEEWSFSGDKYGWSFRIKDKKRVLIYLLPRDGFFKAAFVFGQKAYDEILKSNISESIKTDLRNARVYAEGRGLRIEVKNSNYIKDIQTLITIKISN